ncbi:hypothetical protein CJ030_MR1G010284 [Morella rubra]|uniref:PGG domain-containing protein n=1 Tax=Morella rubra TaxID=262757 RepID=A0A6A1WS52_9ROSI|nr:hypothetical protein CJ030_MR1G010284 [Morella rubra]
MHCGMRDREGKEDEGGGGGEGEQGLYRESGRSPFGSRCTHNNCDFYSRYYHTWGFQSGDDSHPGSAILRGSAAFRAFVVSNELSMLSSTCAVFIHLFVPGLREIEHRENFLLAAWLMILLAMGAMVLAFITGSYAVLAPSLPLAIFSCIIGLFFFPLLFLIFRKALKD